MIISVQELRGWIKEVGALIVFIETAAVLTQHTAMSYAHQKFVLNNPRQYHERYGPSRTSQLAGGPAARPGIKCIYALPCPACVGLSSTTLRGGCVRTNTH